MAPLPVVGPPAACVHWEWRWLPGGRLPMSSSSLHISVRVRVGVSAEGPARAQVAGQAAAWPREQCVACGAGLLSSRAAVSCGARAWSGNGAPRGIFLLT